MVFEMSSIESFIIDDFLHSSDSDKVHDFLLTDGFPWHITSGTVHDMSQADVTWFHHIFSYDNKIISNFYYSFFFLFEARFRDLGVFPSSIRANLMPPSVSGGKTEPHVDRRTDHFVGIYYVNNSSAKTVLMPEGEMHEVEAVKNRLLVFDGSITHCANLPTAEFRSVVNFVFDGSYADHFTK